MWTVAAHALLFAAQAPLPSALAVDRLPPVPAVGPDAQRPLVETALMAGQAFALESLHRLQGEGGKCLNFLHIPKAAGTSLEGLSLQMAAAELRRAGDGAAAAVTGWGINDRSLVCKNQTPFEERVLCPISGSPAGPSNCSRHHVPPSWDRLLEAAYARCTTFCVVRHPVQRLVSEASFRNTSCDSAAVDGFLREALEQWRHDPTLLDCHLLPQAEYVYGGLRFGADGSWKPGRFGNYCQRVLRMETLERDFQHLMAEFELPLKLVGHRNAFNCNVTLTPETEELIRQTYKVDFELFGYGE